MEKLKKNTETFTCESCGTPFECGAKTGNCRCFSIAIPSANLAQLNQQFKNCLCLECLQNSLLPKNTFEKSKES